MRFARDVLSIATALCLFVGCVACGTSWYRYGSAEPRCAFHVPGYSVTHYYRAGTETVTCEYQAELDAPLTRGSSHR